MPYNKEKKAAYYRTHKVQRQAYDKARSKQKAAYAKIYDKARRAANPEKLAAHSRAWRKQFPEKYMLAGARSKAKRGGFDFNLTTEDIFIPEYCPVLGISLCWSDDGRADNTPSLDRIDNTKGYIRGNVAVISWKANQLKRDGTLKDFQSIVKYMLENIGDSND